MWAFVFLDSVTSGALNIVLECATSLLRLTLNLRRVRRLPLHITRPIFVATSSAAPAAGHTMGQTPDTRNQSTLIPASLITLAHLAVSDFIVVANCSGEPVTADDPLIKNRYLTSALFKNRTISWFSRSNNCPGRFDRRPMQHLPAILISVAHVDSLALPPGTVGGNELR